MSQTLIGALQAAYDAGDLDKLLALYDEAGSLDLTPEARVYAGTAHLDRGNLLNAYGLANHAVSEASGWPDTGSAHRLLGRVYLAMGQPEEAVSEFQIAESAARSAGATQCARILYDYGQALRQCGVYDTAVKLYSAAADQFREDRRTSRLCQTLHDLAWAACLGGDSDAARTALDESARLCWGDEDRLHQQLGMQHLTLLTGGRRERLQALEWCDQIAIEPELEFEVRAQAAWLSCRLQLAMDGAATAANGIGMARALAVQSHSLRLMRDVDRLQAQIQDAAQSETQASVD